MTDRLMFRELGTRFQVEIAFIGVKAALAILIHHQLVVKVLGGHMWDMEGTSFPRRAPPGRRSDVSAPSPLPRLV
jgi:hypothetical protein